MFTLTTEEEDVKDYAKNIIDERVKKHVDKIKENDEGLSGDKARNIEDKLKNWRLKESKREFVKKIN